MDYDFCDSQRISPAEVAVGSVGGGIVGPVDRDDFAARLARSAQVAREFAQAQVIEQLPEAIVFRVRLNQSYDGQAPRPGELRFPEDSGWERAMGLHRCDFDTVVNELWRDGHVPEWVNLSVVDETGEETVVEVVCCGRFTRDDNALYHAGEGAPPFHVLGPVLPPVHDGARFSIHLRAECWDSHDVQRLAGYADQIWSLDLFTDGPLPDLPALEILEHHRCQAATFSGFERFPRLRVLRLTLNGEFQVDGSLERLESLTLANLPDRPWGSQALAVATPALTWLALDAPATLWLDGALPNGVNRLQLKADRLAGTPQLPTRLEHLSVHLHRGDQPQVMTLLQGVQEVRWLSLQGTPVSDELRQRLARRYELDHLS